MAANLAYRRVLLKLSGEALMGEKGFGLDPETMRQVATEIKGAVEMGTQFGVVVGGGNIFRGLSETAKGMDRVAADSMGMLATVINAVALTQTLSALGVKATAMSAVPAGRAVTVYDRDEALNLLAAGTVVVFGAGTGLPYFTTDTAAALRAVEIEAEAIFKMTKVDGVYDSDPMVNPEAERFDELTYDEVIVRNLRVMDQTAVAFCRDNSMPMLVFKAAPGNLKAAVAGTVRGTRILGGE